jgi:hypothetical protein
LTRTPFGEYRKMGPWITSKYVSCLEKWYSYHIFGSIARSRCAGNPPERSKKIPKRKSQQEMGLVSLLVGYSRCSKQQLKLSRTKLTASEGSERGVCCQ